MGVKYQGGGASGVSTRFTNRIVTSDTKRQLETIKTKRKHGEASIKSEANVMEQGTRGLDQAWSVHNKIREYENQQLAQLPKALQTMAGVWHKEEIQDNKEAILEGKHKFDLHGHDFKEVLKDTEVSKLLLDTENNKNAILQRMHDMEVPVETINRWTSMSPVAQSGFIQRSIQAKGENTGVAFINWKNESIESGREFNYIGTDEFGNPKPPQTFTLADEDITPDMWRVAKSEFYADYSADLPGVKASIKNELFDENFNNWGDTFIKEKVTGHVIKTATTNIEGLNKKVEATFKALNNLSVIPGNVDSEKAADAKVAEAKTLVKNLYGLLRAQNNDLSAAQGLSAQETAHSKSMTDLKDILQTAIIGQENTSDAIETANLFESILEETINPNTGIALSEHEFFKENALYIFARDHKKKKDEIAQGKFQATTLGEGDVMIQSGRFDKYTDTKEIWAYLQETHGWNMDTMEGWQMDLIRTNIINKIQGHTILSDYEWVMKVQSVVSDTNKLIFSREDFPGITEEAIKTLSGLGVLVSDDSFMDGEADRERVEDIRSKVKMALYPAASASGLPFSKIQNDAVDAVMYDILLNSQNEKIEQNGSGKPPQPDHVIFQRHAATAIENARRGASGKAGADKTVDGQDNPYFTSPVDGPEGWVGRHESQKHRTNLIESLQELAEIRHARNTVGLAAARKKGILKNNLQLFESDGGIPPVYNHKKKLQVLADELGYNGTPGNTFDDFIREQGLEQLTNVGESGGTDQSDLPNNLIMQQYMDSPNKEAFMKLVGKDNSHKAVARAIIMANGGAGDYETVSKILQRIEWLEPTQGVTHAPSMGIHGGFVKVDKADAKQWREWERDKMLLTDAQEDISKIKDELQPIVNRLDENDLNITFTNSERGNIKRLFMDGTRQGVTQGQVDAQEKLNKDLDPKDRVNLQLDRKGRKWNRREWTKISATAKKLAAEGNGSYDYHLLRLIRQSESYQAQLAK